MQALGSRMHNSDILGTIGFVGIFVVVASGMMAIGLSYTIRQIVYPLQNLRLLAVTLLANFLILPLASVVIALALRLDEPLADGLVLLGAASGAPFVPKLTEYARGNLPFAIATTIVLTAATIIWLPLALPIMRSDVIVAPLTVARPLVLFILLPLGVGLGVRAYSEPLAERLKPVLDGLANSGFLPVVLLVAALNARNVLHIFGTGGILAGILLLGFGLGVGWLLGGPSGATRRALALSTGLRNFAVAIMIASEDFEDPAVEIMVIVTAVVALLILLPLSRLWGLKPIVN
jgi:BASS family bile acid:Na+ symporter